jgi:hypothetical protein
MEYLVDGHNLIGRMPGLALSDPDDEAKLVDLLGRWTLREPRHRVTVVFDGGVYGHPSRLGSSRVRVIFARPPRDADSLLEELLKQISGSRKAVLVSDDRAITAVAEDRGVSVVACRAFAEQLMAPLAPRQKRAKRIRPEPKLSRSEVDAWLEHFGTADE